MSALFNAVANGVSGLMRVGSQSSVTAATGETTANLLDEQSPDADTEKLINIIQATSIEPSTMNMDSVDRDELTAEESHPLAIVETTVQSTTFVPALDSSIQARASSLPINLSNVPEFRVGYVYDDRMMLHSPVELHPEAPARLLGIHQKLRDAGYLTRMKLIPIRLARKSEVLMVHSEDHWEKVQMIVREYISC